MFDIVSAIIDLVLYRCMPSDHTYFLGWISKWVNNLSGRCNANNFEIQKLQHISQFF